MRARAASRGRLPNATSHGIARAFRGDFPVPNHCAPRLWAADGRVDAADWLAGSYGPAGRRHPTRPLCSGHPLARTSTLLVSAELRPEGDDRCDRAARYSAVAYADRNGDRSVGRTPPAQNGIQRIDRRDRLASTLVVEFGVKRSCRHRRLQSASGSRRAISASCSKARARHFRNCARPPACAGASHADRSSARRPEHRVDRIRVRLRRPLLFQPDIQAAAPRDTLRSSIRDRPRRSVMAPACPFVCLPSEMSNGCSGADRAVCHTRGQKRTRAVRGPF
jgi:hypothetical protein